MLARLEHGGVLTTPLDERGTWHRYHPLFAELLRAELRAQLPDEVAQLHRRAATWLAAHGDNAAALRHAAAGGAWDLAADLTTTRWFHMMINGEMGTLRPILETMPRQSVEASPELALAFGGALLARGDHAGAQPYLLRAEEGEALVAPERRASFAASRAAMALYAGRLRGDPKAALRAARELLERDRRPGERRSEQWRAVLRPRPARHRRALDRRPRRRDRASRAGLCQRPRRRQRLDGSRRHGAPRGGARVPRRAPARAAPCRRGRQAGCAARLETIGAGGCRRTACRRPSPSNGASARRPRAWWRSASEALHETRERPLRAVHALNRALLLSDAGEAEAALSVLQVARDEVGEWPLLAPLEDELLAREALLRAAVGERELGRALLERAEREAATSIPVANALARLSLLDGDPGAARDLLAPHLANGDGARGRRRAGVGPRRGVAARRARTRRARRARRRRDLAGALARPRRAGRPEPAHRRARQPRPAPAAPPRAPRDGAPGDRRRSAGRRSSTAEASDHARSRCSWPNR